MYVYVHTHTHTYIFKTQGKSKQVRAFLAGNRTRARALSDGAPLGVCAAEREGGGRLSDGGCGGRGEAGHNPPDSSPVQSQSLELLRDGAGDGPASKRAEKDPLPLEERWRQKSHPPRRAGNPLAPGSLHQHGARVCHTSTRDPPQG